MFIRFRTATHYLVSIVLLLMGSAAQAHSHFLNSADDLKQLYELIDERLALMDDVAAWKWQHDAPVTDTEREQQLLNSMSEYAAKFGFESKPTRQFFQQQIDWASAIQAQRFAAWRAQGLVRGQTSGVGKSVDLAGNIRPKLDAIGREQVRLIYLLAPELPHLLDDHQATQVIDHIANRLELNHPKLNGAGQESSQLILRAMLLAFNVPDAGRMQAIRTSGVLRIGTTGDYLPFSATDDNELKGFDIELALSLAKHLSVEPRFVRTSWPTLMNDLRQRRFDIAASGITVTKERAAEALFSKPYHSDGKTPIARCSERQRYASLQDIDQPNTRVIVNPGGTNEQFARSQLSHAQLRFYEDNRSIFDEVIAGRADVMITDATEVAWQSHMHPELCATTTKRFTTSEKALLLPRSSDAVSSVNDWLLVWSAHHRVEQWVQKTLAN